MRRAISSATSSSTAREDAPEQRAHRRARRLRRAGFDQVGDAFGLRQVDAAVQVARRVNSPGWASRSRARGSA